ncbi:MAG TPA: GNAT family N-acetyltransferase [Opitutus sp.]|nr:GNAT family N-acetyltransferase [Opitutus sp.]
MSHELRHGEYLLTDDRARLDFETIYRYLSEQSYWAAGIPREIVAASLEHALCLGAYTRDGAQVGLIRVVTDYATFAWLCDVFVLPAHRRRGLSKALLQLALSHPRLQTVRRFALGTQDAHGLYAQFGFTPLANPHTQMEKRRPNPYGAKA